MSSFRPPRPRALTLSGRPARSGLTPRTVVAGVAVLAVAGAVALGVAGSGSPRTVGPSTVTAPPTGEVNAMGLPVVATPGRATGTATAGPVEVAAANWSLGTVPLDTAVRPGWVLRNTGREPVTIGEPHPEVRAGCCPGPFTIGTQTLSPGGQTTLTFELAMHEGMDGWHDMAVHVPVITGSGQEVLTLGVAGDFRNAQP